MTLKTKCLKKKEIKKCTIKGGCSVFVEWGCWLLLILKHLGSVHLL